MVVTVTVTNMVRITGEPRDIVRLKPFIRQGLTFNNPEYIAALRSGMHIDEELRKRAKIRAYGFRGRNIVIPRGFYQRIAKYMRDERIEYEVIDKSSSGQLKSKRLKYQKHIVFRPYQKDAVQRAITRSGIIQAPCGSGKTEILTDLIRRHNKRTLVLVHTNDLMEQMVSRIEASLGVQVGVIKQETWDLRDITVGSVQTLRNRLRDDQEDLSEFLRMWGVVVLDEAHHCPAETFSEVMNQFYARHRYGTTATTKRSDNLQGLMYATIGFRLFNITYPELYAGGWLMKARVIPVETKFYHPIRHPRQYTYMIQHLVRDEKRNRLIVDQLVKSRRKHNLVLSGQINHLESLFKMLLEQVPNARARLLTGRHKKEDRLAAIQDMNDGKLNFIFATQLADEGLDLPILDRLHLVFPTRSERKITQQAGRIQRKIKGKRNAIVYDYNDPLIQVLDKQFRERLRIYRDLDFDIKDDIVVGSVYT